MAAKEKLYEDALKLSINKNLADIRTLLEWAQRSNSISEKVDHIRQAITFLQEIERNLSELR